MRLRAEGCEYREIAERMGIPRSTAYLWVSDPSGEQTRARKRRYAGVCDPCGWPTDGSAGPGRAPSRCIECHTWTKEAVLEAFRDWFDEHAEPPRSDARNTQGVLPSHRAVARLFGSWTAALEEAGLPIVCERRAEIWADVRERFRNGATAAELADERGCTVDNIEQHLRRHGIDISRPPAGWTTDTIVAAMRDWKVEHGTPPSSADWWYTVEGCPTYATVRRHFGTWGAALAAAFNTDDKEVADAA